MILLFFYIRTYRDEAAMELHYTARDIFDIWRAVIPQHNEEQLENEPFQAAVFHNDCTYITYHLLALGYHHRLWLPTPVKETCSFLDMVPLFRSLGQQCFRKQLVLSIIFVFRIIRLDHFTGTVEEIA